jgi:hypothetical protein
VTDTPTPSNGPSTPTAHPVPAPAAPPAAGSAAAPASGGPAAQKADLAGLAAAMRSIERGESPVAPAPRGDAAEARRKRREAMAAEVAATQASEAAKAGLPSPADGEPGAALSGDPAATPGDPADGSSGPDEPSAGPGAEDAPQDAEEDAADDADAGDPEDAEDAEDADGTPSHASEGPSGADDGDGADGAGSGHGTAPAGEPAPPAGPAADRTRPEGDPEAPRGQEPEVAEAAGGGAEGPAGLPRTPAPGPQAVGRGGDPDEQRVALDPRAVEAAQRVLVEGGAPGEFAAAAVRGLGEAAAAELRADPWLVLGLEGARVEVERADAFARAVLGAECGPGDERRVRALVGHLMEKAAEAGHTALPAETLKAALARHAVPDPGTALGTAVEEGQLLVFREDGDLPGSGAGDGHGPGSEGGDGDDDGDGDEQAPVPLLFGLDRYALAEESLADDCVRLMRSFEGDAVDWEAAAAAAPSPSAAELIRAAAAHALVLHTGGEAARAEPAALVAAARAAGLRAYAAAYTENGRRRLAAVVGEEAALTVRGLLAGGRAPDGSLPVDLVAVLDAPQLSVEEAATLAEAVPDGARLVLSGDPHALLSAGPGRAFADLLASRACPRVTSRTPDPGPIGELTSCVGEGELARVDAPDKEVVVVPVHDPREAVHRTVQLFADSVPRAFGVRPEQIQVITPAHGGPAGTRALNAALKERLNPGPGRFAGFDPGDRVVHVPAPGRTLPGTVVGAEPDGLRLACEHGPVLVPREDVAATVRHGWAITGHQAAAMRWDAAVVVVPGDAGPLLTRSWVYTAFTRGERHLSVVQGAEQGLAQAVAGPAAKERTTRLGSVLRELAAES